MEASAGSDDSKQPTGQATRSSSEGREALKLRLFKQCDRDGDGMLNKDEMRQLATLVGFEGSDAEWDQEYEKLCAEHSLDLDKGIPRAVVQALLEDESDTGCFCTDREILQLLGDGPGEVGAPRTRGMDKNAGKTVFFAKCNFASSESAIKATFAEAGTVEDFRLFRLPDGRSRGMGRVAFSSEAEARWAIDNLHQRKVDGSIMVVKEDTRDNEPTGGKGGGCRDGAGAGRGGKGVSWRTPLAGMGGAFLGKGGYGAYGGADPYYYGGGYNNYGGCGDYGSYGGSGNYAGYDYDYDGSGGVGHWGGQRGDAKAVFFAGASFESTEDSLHAVFAEAGQINQFWLFQLPDGRSRGMGVVQYHTSREAKYAADVLQGRDLDGRELFVKRDNVGVLLQHQDASYGCSPGKGSPANYWSGGKGGKGVGGRISKGAKGGKGVAPWQNLPRVFFTGAPFQVPAKDVQEYFAEFGDIRSFTLFRLPDGRSRGMGIVTFDDSECAAEVLRHGITIDSRPLYMQEDTSQYNDPNGGKAAAKGSSAIATYGGPPPRATGQRYAYMEPEGDYGYGYEDSYGYSLKSGSATTPSPKIPVDPSKTVFFTNVPFGTTESHLKGRFETVGTVNTIKLFTTFDGRSRGMGVVEYTTEEAAERAYYELHDQVVSGRQIIVDEYRPPQ